MGAPQEPHLCQTCDGVLPDDVWMTIAVEIRRSDHRGTTARKDGPFNPEISEALTVAPEVVYSPIVKALAFTTNRFEPDTAQAPWLDQA